MYILGCWGLHKVEGSLIRHAKAIAEFRYILVKHMFHDCYSKSLRWSPIISQSWYAVHFVDPHVSIWALPFSYWVPFFITNGTSRIGRHHTAIFLCFCTQWLPLQHITRAAHQSPFPAKLATALCFLRIRHSRKNPHQDTGPRNGWYVNSNATSQMGKFFLRCFPVWFSPNLTNSTSCSYLGIEIEYKEDSNGFQNQITQKKKKNRSWRNEDGLVMV